MMRGFTLIELSIVLVIIGLLTGGILIAQSLIESVKLNRFISSISEYDALVNSFQSRYRSLPGDSRLFTTGGNNDGAIGTPTYSTSDVIFTGEVANFWKHLSDAGFKPQGQSFVNTLNPAPNFGVRENQIPSVDYGETGGGIGVANMRLPGPDNNYYRNVYIIGDYFSDPSSFMSSVIGGNPLGLFHPFNDAMVIDNKMDDGVYNTGRVSAERQGILMATSVCDYNGKDPESYLGSWQSPDGSICTLKINIGFE